MPESPLTNAARLREFHRAADVVAPARPTVPGPELLTLRRTLIREEAREVEAEFTARILSRPSFAPLLAREEATLERLAAA